MKTLIDDLRASQDGPFWVEAKVNGCDVDVMVDGSLLYLDLTNGYISGLVRRNDPSLFNILKLVEEQARRKELEAIIAKQTASAKPKETNLSVSLRSEG